MISSAKVVVKSQGRFKRVLLSVLTSMKFENKSLETKFINEFRLAGLLFIRFALFLGIFSTLLFFLHVILRPDEEYPLSDRQIIRLSLFIILALVMVFIEMNKEVALKYYLYIIGGCFILSVLAIGAMSLLPADLIESRSGRWAIAMVLVCWLAFGFSRIPPLMALIICGVGSGLVLESARLYNDEYLGALYIYLLMANLIGWVLSRQIERLERDVFFAKIELGEMYEESNLLAKKAQAANQAKSRILAAVNHDLRQPLASMALYMQQLREQLSIRDPDLLETADCLDACVTAISSDLDHLAEIGSEGQESSVPVVVVDLRTVLERVERVYARLARDSGVRLVIRMPEPGRCLVMSNESRLWDILSNLLSNALKFRSHDRAPWVLVRVRRNSGWWRLVVQDNGIGIPGRAHERIFEEYFRVTGAERARGNGQGLGLAIVRDAAGRLDDHSICFDSRPGTGTRFSLRMPAAAADAVVSTAVAAGAMLMGDAGSNRGAAGSMTALPDESLYPVLLVEDDEAMSRALARSLERWGYSVRRAATGEEAIRLVEDAQDLLVAIISDFRLPGGWDGLRLIERLRVLEGQRTPALLLSGEFRVETLRNDAPDDVGILSKPPDISRLRAFLDDARQSQIF